MAGKLVEKFLSDFFFDFKYLYIIKKSNIMNNIKNFGEFLFEKKEAKEEMKDKKEKCPTCNKKMKKCVCKKEDDKKDEE